jgi:hypothetical protein
MSEPTGREKKMQIVLGFRERAVDTGEHFVDHTDGIRGNLDEHKPANKFLHLVMRYKPDLVNGERLFTLRE